MSAGEVCRTFRNTGKCRFGDDCKFEHSAGEIIIPPRREARYPTEKCPRQAETGTCSRGRFCPFYHSEEDKNRAIPDICLGFRRGNCRYGDKCPREHVKVSPEERRAVDCATWVRTGECKANESELCVFTHADEKRGVGASTSAEGATEGAESKPRRRGRGRGRRTGPGAAGSSDAAATEGANNNAAEGAESKPRRRGRGRGRRSPKDATEGSAEASSPVSNNVEGAKAEGETKGRRRRTRGRGRRAEGESTETTEKKEASAEGDANGERRSRRRRRERKAPTGEGGTAEAPGLCYSWRDNEGVCKFGDDCRYKHGDNDTRDFSQRRAAKVNQVCYKFKSGEECPFGENCKYIHDLSAPDPQASA